jgi:hypothetical protein
MLTDMMQNHMKVSYVYKVRVAGALIEVKHHLDVNVGEFYEDIIKHYKRNKFYAAADDDLVIIPPNIEYSTAINAIQLNTNYICMNENQLQIIMKKGKWVLLFYNHTGTLV